MTLKKLGNYQIFLLSSSFMALATGLFSPFWFVFLHDFGESTEQFGLLIGTMAVAQSVTSYFSGKYSDRFGRRIFMIIGGFLLAAIVFSYTLVTSLLQLYVLQFLNGAVSAVQGTIERAFLADITTKPKRGAAIGKYQAIIGVLTAITMMAGGFVAGKMGFKSIFFLTSGMILGSTLLLFHLRERSRG